MRTKDIVKELENLPTTVHDGFYQLRITHDLRDEIIKLLERQKPLSPITEGSTERVIRAVDSCFDYWLDQHRCLHPLELEDVRQLKADALVLLKEQEIGHWILLEDCSNSGVYCSECNTKVFDNYPFKKKLSYFCPHCGTRMEGEIERR